MNKIFVCWLQGSCLPVSQPLVSCQAVSESITNTALRERAAAQGSTPRCSRPPLPPPPPLHMDQPPPLEPSSWPTTPLSLNSPPTSDKAGSLGHTVGPVFSVSFNVQCTLFTVFLTLPLQSGQGVSITEKTSIEIKGWAPTAESRTFEVCYIYICSKLQLVILFFWGRVIHCGATKRIAWQCHEHKERCDAREDGIVLRQSAGLLECCIKARFFTFLHRSLIFGTGVHALHLYLLHSWIKQQELLSAITKENKSNVLA